MPTRYDGREPIETRHMRLRDGYQSSGALHATMLCLLLSLSVCACYQYFPVEDVKPMPEPRTDVRIRLTTPVSLEAGSQTLHHVNGVEGDVYRCSGDTLAVFSRWLRTSYGYRQPMDGSLLLRPLAVWQAGGASVRTHKDGDRGGRGEHGDPARIGMGNRTRRRRGVVGSGRQRRRRTPDQSASATQAPRSSIVADLVIRL